MASTDFANGVTVTDEDWFDDVNRLHYVIFGDPTNLASAQAAMFSGAPSFTTTNLTVAGTLSVSALAAVQGLQVAGILSVSALAAVQGLQVAGALSVSAKAAVNALQVGGVLSATSIAGDVIATQAQMEAAASSDVVVTPLRLHFHPAAAKAWVRFDGTATSVTAAAAYNVASITDKGTGNYNIIFSTAFSSGNFAAVPGANLYNVKLTSMSAASVELTVVDLSGTAADAAIVTLVAFGDQ
jgi:hypothetical protein